MSERLGILGGTFDPVHIGHLVAAEAAAETLGLDEVCLMVAAAPWQKADRPLAPAEDRYCMAVIATASNPRLSVSRAELDRQGPTYTLDSLREIHARRPGAELYFIAGGDVLRDLGTWRDPAEVLKLVTFVVVTRPGHADATVPAGLPAKRVATVETPAVDVSSTQIRARVGAGRTIRYLVPDPVHDYIRNKGLYKPCPA